MTAYLIGRLGQGIFVLLVVSILAFVLLHLAPGDPAALLYGPDLSAEELRAVRTAWGLDDPLPVQYLRWLSRLLQLDFGRSFADGRPARDVILERLPATLYLTLSALGLALVFGVTAGIVSALRPLSWLDYTITTVSTVLYSAPNFWLGLLLVLVFSVWLGWLPSAGMQSVRGPTSPGDRFAHLILPAFVLSLREVASLTRYTRAGMVEVLSQDYIRLARAKGLPEYRVIVDHAFRNAALPVITLVGLFIPRLVGGSVVVETLFSWPGMGRLVVEAAFARNYPVLMGEVVLVGAVVILGSLLADLAYGLADPRIRYDGRRR